MKSSQSSRSLHKRSKSEDLKSFSQKQVSLKRRLSFDANNNRIFICNVKETIEKILLQEDTFKTFQITILSTGPKSISLGSFTSDGFKMYEIRGTYMISNLLQELSLAADCGLNYLIFEEGDISENPVDRLCRLIKTKFWDELTRRVDASGLVRICEDPKNSLQEFILYVPYFDSLALEYFQKVAIDRPLLKLPESITPEFVNSINDKMGILSLKLESKIVNGEKFIHGVPFVVPGDGWDSYFEALGLLKDDRLDLAKSHIDNFVYQINHYNKILNANRSYYLTRSQPPFLTDMIKRVYIELLKDTNTRRDNEELQLWLKEATSASIKELLSVWLSPPRLDKIGLSKYVTEGSGIPPETENGHFDYILKPFANELGMSIEDYRIGYINGSIIESELDEFFKHDRAVRESGHDTSYRFDGICANVATIDLNCLVYKYETDLKSIINDFFDGAIEFLVRVKYLDNFLAWFENYQRFGVDLGNWDSKWARGIIIYNVPLNTEDSKYSESFGDVSFSVYKDFFSVSLQSNLFKSLSIFTRSKVNEYLWNDQDGLYHDYNCVTREQTVYISATNFFALWSEIASVEQAARMVPNALSLLTEQGGLASGTRESRGEISEDRPQRQWDYPFGWVPHQICAWHGLRLYKYNTEGSKIAYRWLYMITKSFADFNGVVPEKFNVVNLCHDSSVEYGTVGTDFKLVSKEGFGWMNASYVVGLEYLSVHMRRALGTLTEPDVLFDSLGI